MITMAERTSVTIAQRSPHHGHARHIRRRRDPKVPVVKVNPFMSEREHTWSKERSLPEFYEKPDVVHTTTEAFVKPPPTAFSTSSDSMLTTRENRPILPISQLNKPNVEAANVASSPPKTSPTKIRLFEDPPYVESIRGRRVVFPPTPRDQCISPENPIKRLPKHGFAPTIVDREKKTVVESPVTKPTSLLNRERTREFVSKQQVLKLRGLRMIDGGQLAPAPSTYLRPTAMPLKSLEDFYRQLVNSYNRGYAFSPIKTRHSHNGATQLAYNPQRYHTDPLLSLNHESVSQRFCSSMDTVDSKSAFRILESEGKPTSIEQNLARDYTMLCDTNKQSSSVASTGHHFTRFLKLKNYNPTQGELFIMVNKEQNRPGRRTSRSLHQQSMTVASQSAMPTRSHTMYQNSENGDTAELVSPENRENTGGDMEESAAKASLYQDDNPTPNQKQGEVVAAENNIDKDSNVRKSPFSSEDGRKSGERLEITTTLPDINHNSNNI